eukprot:symbB.v1.2.002342.t1/scaffold121.1/size317807/6
MAYIGDVPWHGERAFGQSMSAASRRQTPRRVFWLFASEDCPAHLEKTSSLERCVGSIGALGTTTYRATGARVLGCRAMSRKSRMASGITLAGVLQHLG